MLEEYVRPFPRVVRIEPAAACNLSCSHCPTGTVEMVRGIMKPETFARVVEDVKANLDSIKVVVLYHGGEPLLNKAFPEMIGEIKSLGVPLVKTVSNGMLMTDKTISGIIANGLDVIEFSLDGENVEQNNFIRRNCDFATVVANIKRLIDQKRLLKSELPKIYISTTQFLTKEEHHLKAQDPAIPEFLRREFTGEYQGEIAGYKPTWAMRWPHMEILEDVYEVYHDPEDTEESNYCDHVENTVTIRWNGDVVTCCYDLTSKYVAGNVHQDNLDAIWNNKRYLGIRQSIDRKKFIPMCANCNVVKPSVYLILKREVAAKLN